MPPSLDVAGPARRLGGRLRSPRSAQGRRPVCPASEGEDVQRPVPAELRRLPWSGRQAGPGASAQRQAVPGPDTGHGAAARHRGRTTRHADAGIRHGQGRRVDGRAGQGPGRGHQARWGPVEPAPSGAPPYLLARLGPMVPRPETKTRASRCSLEACASCHGDTVGRPYGGQSAGAINDPDFLALISDQALRRYVITGGPISACRIMPIRQVGPRVSSR